MTNWVSGQLITTFRVPVTDYSVQYKKRFEYSTDQFLTTLPRRIRSHNINIKTSHIREQISGPHQPCKSRIECPANSSPPLEYQSQTILYNTKGELNIPRASSLEIYKKEHGKTNISESSPTHTLQFILLHSLYATCCLKTSSFEVWWACTQLKSLEKTENEWRTQHVTGPVM